METPIQVSVVVPCYNYAKYLPDCIESLVHQTYPLKEIIIVNDKSPDNTEEVALELIRKYPDKNIKLFNRNENGGLGAARNSGIRIAQGEYICCLDADDKLVPAGIEEHVRLIENDTTLAQCALMEFGERHIMMTPTNPTNLKRVLQSNTIYCNAMFSKRMWKQAGGFDEGQLIRYGLEDWEFWIRLLAEGCHVNTSEFVSLRYRVHGSNMTKATTHPHRQELYNYIYEKHRKLYEENNCDIAGRIIN